MGYNSRMNISLRIKRGNIREVRNTIEHAKSILETQQCHNYGESLIPEWQERFFDSMIIANDGSIELYDSDGKWYDDEMFADWLKDKVTRGSIIFDGEDGAKWGYEFDGKGHVRTLQAVMKPVSEWA